MHWVIGDVHGMLRPLEALLAAVTDRDPGRALYFCGDYCDRGPDTRGVVEVLLGLVADGTARCVRGNHDDVFDLCLNRHSVASGREGGGEATQQDVDDAARLFWREGLLNTMQSYGVDLARVGGMIGDRPRIDGWVREQFAAVPDSHRSFFRNLPLVAEADGFFVCHAMWPADEPDAPAGGMDARALGDRFLRYDCLWGRYVANQLRSRKNWGRRGYVGHTPTDTYLGHDDLIAAPGDVIGAPRLVLCDTAAFAPGGRLSAVCHETGTVLQADAAGRVREVGS